MICDEMLAPPSGQMQLPIEDTWMDRARAWVKEHPREWDYFKQRALMSARPSAKACVMATRERFRVSINDGLSSSLARIAKEEDPRIRFRFKSSKVDGLTTADLG